MLLVDSQTTKYKSVDDSLRYSVEPTITCLVGKNESGKSALLESIYRVKPLPAGLIDEFDGLRDYPRRTFAFDEDSVPDTTAIASTYELDAEEMAAFEQRFGKALRSPLVYVSKNYSNKRFTHGDVDHAVLLDYLKNHTALAGLDLTNATSEADIRAIIDAVEDPSDTLTALRKLLAISLTQQCTNWFAARLPRALLFTQYSTMAGTVSIERLQTVAAEDLEPHERTALSLLRLAKVDTEQFDESNYEARKARLEAAANALTDEVFEFWSQNEDLQVELDIDFVDKESDPTQREPFLKIRIRNNQHRVTLDFAERSVGFVWFFSFLAFFSEYRNSDEPLLLLLDEPGLNLHAAAQEDLLRFIEERLAVDHQVIYSTHSPFMIQANHLERVRLIEDRKGEGTRVREDALGSQDETQFSRSTLRSESERHRHCSSGKTPSIVEGPADLMYLRVMSDHLASRGRTALNEGWVVTPVGGLDKIPTFIALLSQQLKVVALHDSDGKRPKRLQDLVDQHVVDDSHVVDVLEFATSTKSADLEDLFDDVWYLALLSTCGIADISASEMKSKDPRIVRRVEHHLGHQYSHYTPAGYLARHPEVLDNVGEDAEQRFEDLFTHLNDLLVTN